MTYEASICKYWIIIKPNSMTEKKKDLIKLSAEHFNFLKFFANIEGDMYSVPWKYRLFRENDDGTAYLEIIMPENQSIKP